jgi:putative transposase
MPRAARIVVCGVPYHITQRGNNRQEVFLDEQDYLTYLRLLAHYARARGLEILGYCLMSNHVHLIAVPTLETSLAQAVGHANLRYAQIANERYERSGHLWQSRHYACPLDRAHLVAAMRYVERNPVRAGLAEEPWEYPWSSAAAHVGGTDQYALLAFDGWRREWSPAAWRDFIAGPDDDWQLERIRLVAAFVLAEPDEGARTKRAVARGLPRDSPTKLRRLAEIRLLSPYFPTARRGFALCSGDSLRATGA